MKAAAIDRFGSPSVITVHTLPVPRPGDREILIALHAAGVGRWDESVRDGSWQPAAVGTLAVQFAKRRGSRVIATASGGPAANLVRRLGADAVIDARSEKAADRLRELAPDGIDAVLALAGGEELERCLDFVRRGGRIAHPNGIDPEPKRRRGFRIRGYDALAGSRECSRLERAVDEARLRVPIAAQYPLAAAAAAHRRQHRRVVGRIVLRIRRRAA
jgi:NADPH2:quinone reductase